MYDLFYGFVKDKTSHKIQYTFINQTFYSFTHSKRNKTCTTLPATINGQNSNEMT